MKPHRWRRTHLLAVTSIVICLALAARAGGARVTTMIETGPSDNRVDMVFLGDGYTSDQIETTYVSHISNTLNHLFNEQEDPYPRYRNFFNVHRINVVSNEAGADIPPEGIFRDTALDASYYYDGRTKRLLAVDSAKADAVIDRALRCADFDPEIQLVTVNDTMYGGSAGSFAVYAGGNGAGPEIALHEIGHVFNGLADEYAGIVTAYNGREPEAANITKSSDGQKWDHWLGYVQPGIGVIDAYKGAGYHNNGLYRSSANSKMRILGRPFDAVAREKIILDIYELVDPLDDWLDNDQTLVNPDELWVKTIDPDVIKLEWRIDGVLLEHAESEIFNLTDYVFDLGMHTISVRAYDPTDWVRQNRDELEMTVSWVVGIAMAVPEPTVLCILVAATPILLRRRR